MSKLNQLIEELCPTGVPFTELRDVCQIKNGKDWKTQEYGDIPVYGSGGRMDATVLTPSYDKPTVLLPRKGSLNVQYVEEPFWNVDTVFYTICDEKTVDPKFLFYYLKTINLAAISMSSTRPSLTQSALSKIRVPLAPLPVQQEIVRILDMFTQLEAELEAELEARRKQYNYFRTDLLNNNNIETRSLSDLLLSLSSGKNNSRVERGQYPVFGSTGRIGSTDRAVYTDDAILIARVGANAGRVNAVSGAYDVSDNTLILRPTPELNIRFAFHLLTNMDLNQYALGAGQPLITGKRLKNLNVSVPSMSEQIRIAEILDKFEALVNDHSSGLPAEIAARRKQYEYYRDKLLSFEELLA